MSIMDGNAAAPEASRATVATFILVSIMEKLAEKWN